MAVSESIVQYALNPTSLEWIQPMREITALNPIGSGAVQRWFGAHWKERTGLLGLIRSVRVSLSNPLYHQALLPLNPPPFFPFFILLDFLFLFFMSLIGDSRLII